ncbi:MAG TPA: hypothetical protein VFN68_03960 [Acidimicrobiales bacterium]|nr:hypothetical protein [Acidimicrobiales bacterium]
MWFPLFVDPRLATPPGDPVPPVLQWLDGAGAVTVGTAADAAEVNPGDLVDLVGESQGNPLIRVLDFVATSMAALDDSRPEQAVRGARARTRATPVTGPDEGAATPEAQRLVTVLASAARQDLRSAPVVDVVVVVDDDLPVILTVDRAVAGPGTEALLDSGRYRVIGKVCEVIGPGEGISLLRRTLLSATGLDGGRDMLAELAAGGADLAMTDPVVEGPALAVIPLAILI